MQECSGILAARCASCICADRNRVQMPGCAEEIYHADVFLKKTAIVLKAEYLQSNFGFFVWSDIENFDRLLYRRPLFMALYFFFVGSGAFQSLRNGIEKQLGSVLVAFAAGDAF